MFSYKDSMRYIFQCLKGIKDVPRDFSSFGRAFGGIKNIFSARNGGIKFENSRSDLMYLFSIQFWCVAIVTLVSSMLITLSFFVDSVANNGGVIISIFAVISSMTIIVIGIAIGFFIIASVIKSIANSHTIAPIKQIKAAVVLFICIAGISVCNIFYCLMTILELVFTILSYQSMLACILEILAHSVSILTFVVLFMCQLRGTLILTSCEYVGIDSQYNVGYQNYTNNWQQPDYGTQYIMTEKQYAENENPGFDDEEQMSNLFGDSSVPPEDYIPPVQNSPINLQK